ncbi:16924_t:CDS:2 [Gigaspora margarita]|uniref:16924_t:CDS:1 n=1 Tax=Gigaspora margarita TaxID=4874 RepID=A0ABN7UHU1_GIGMA|nr:16924_t:CDS:2 [Gigaspora margarita]
MALFLTDYALLQQRLIEEQIGPIQDKLPDTVDNSVPSINITASVITKPCSPFTYLPIKWKTQGFLKMLSEKLEIQLNWFPSKLLNLIKVSLLENIIPEFVVNRYGTFVDLEPT